MTSRNPLAQLNAQLDSLTTEAFRPELAGIDLLPTLDIARLMNAEDSAVPAAVAAQLPRIGAVIDAVAARMARGGGWCTPVPVPPGGSGCWTRPSARRPSTRPPGRSSG